MQPLPGNDGQAGRHPVCRCMSSPNDLAKFLSDADDGSAPEPLPMCSLPLGFSLRPGRGYMFGLVTLIRAASFVFRGKRIQTFGGAFVTDFSVHFWFIHYYTEYGPCVVHYGRWLQTSKRMFRRMGKIWRHNHVRPPLRCRANDHASSGAEGNIQGDLRLTENRRTLH